MAVTCLPLEAMAAPQAPARPPPRLEAMAAQAVAEAAVAAAAMVATEAVAVLTVTPRMLTPTMAVPVEPMVVVAVAAVAEQAGPVASTAVMAGKPAAQAAQKAHLGRQQPSLILNLSELGLEEP